MDPKQEDRLEDELQESGAEKIRLGLKGSIRINWKAISINNEQDLDLHWHLNQACFNFISILMKGIM